MIDQKKKNRAVLLLLILIAIGGVVLYGTEKVPAAIPPPHYDAQ